MINKYIYIYIYFFYYYSDRRVVHPSAIEKIESTLKYIFSNFFLKNNSTYPQDPGEIVVVAVSSTMTCVHNTKKKKHSEHQKILFNFNC
jgi:hypothetical protein